MSSPRMNNIIILGCVFIYVSGILFGIDSEVASGKAHERVCQVRYPVKHCKQQIICQSVYCLITQIATCLLYLKGVKYAIDVRRPL